jgi:precorrin isomerase
VQFDQLKQNRRNDAEKLLSLFDQGNRTSNRHILKVDENEYPEMCRPIIRRLLMASGDADIQAEMEMEDDFMKELQDKERSIIEKDRALEKKDKIIEEDKKVIKEKDKALEEKDKLIKEEKKVNEENKKALEEQNKLIKKLQEQLAKSQ